MNNSTSDCRNPQIIRPFYFGNGSVVCARRKTALGDRNTFERGKRAYSRSTRAECVANAFLGQWGTTTVLSNCTNALPLLMRTSILFECIQSCRGILPFLISKSMGLVRGKNTHPDYVSKNLIESIPLMEHSLNLPQSPPGPFDSVRSIQRIYSHHFECVLWLHGSIDAKKVKPHHVNRMKSNLYYYLMENFHNWIFAFVVVVISVTCDEMYVK